MCLRSANTCLILKVTYLLHALKTINHHDSRNYLEAPVRGENTLCVFMLVDGCVHT